MLAHNVTITHHLSDTLSAFFHEHTFSRIGIVVDENTEQHCYPLLRELLPDHHVCSIRSGEQHKTLETCAQLWGFMTQAQFDRQALLINLGGGVIGDMGGFCAATYKRGIRFINLPTTLLSQVDASVGGKLGIDFEGYKNHIGLFQEPLRVIIDPQFLATLPPDELRSGYAEVIKHSLIADADYWPTVRQSQWRKHDWAKIVGHSVGIKSEVVAQDFREGGLRKILNFGHTVGHAVESFYLETDRRLLHGEAIAVGMVAECYLSEKYSALSAEQSQEAIDFLLEVYGHRPLPESDLPAIVALAAQDKKNVASKIRCSLLKAIGEAVYDIDITADDIRESLVYYNGCASA